MSDDRFEVFDGAWVEGSGEIRTLYQSIVVEPGEDMAEVARSLVGIKGRAVLLDCTYLDPNDQWPTAVYRGTVRELAAIRAKVNGRPSVNPIEYIDDP